MEEWSREETAAVAAKFFASPFGAVLEDDDQRSLLMSVLWFCPDYAPGDPWRWSRVTVEMLLADWFPRKAGRRTGRVSAGQQAGEGSLRVA